MKFAEFCKVAKKCWEERLAEVCMDDVLGNLSLRPGTVPYYSNILMCTEAGGRHIMPRPSGVHPVDRKAPKRTKAPQR